jgi:hypothetical protein
VPVYSRTMFGPRLNTVFASRWKALLWAGGILMMAYCSIPAPEEEQTVAPAPAAPAEHKSPWAK